MSSDTSVNGVQNTQNAQNTQDSQNKNSAKKTSDLSMQDFFKLLAAQLQNQNVLDPVDNTEFLSQMAQFSSLSAMQELSSNFNNLLSVTYLGKTVTATRTTSTGTESFSGKVDKVEYLS